MFKIYVGNLSAKASVEAIRDLFSRHIEIEDIAFPLNDAGRPRGFAIVMTKDDRQGRAAIMSLRGTRMDNKRLIINEARKKRGKSEMLRRQTSRMRARFRPNSRRPARGFGSAERPETPRSTRPGNGPSSPPSSGSQPRV